MDGVHADQHGFTLVEVMVAATILLIGLLGVGMMLDQAATATWSTKAREQGISLQRELVEAARAIPYDQLTHTAVVGRVQGAPGAGLGDASNAGGWTIRRRGFTYGVTLGVCSVDDPADGTGVHDPATFCASGAGRTTPQQCSTWLGATGSVQGAPAAAGAGVAVGDCGVDLNLDGSVDNLVEAQGGICVLGICTPSATVDSSPDDYKRIVSLVRWDRGTGKRYALQSSTLPNPGLSSAPAVAALTTTATDPVVSGTSAAFGVVTNREPATVAWFIDGTHQASATGAGTAWSFNWALGSVSSGSTPNSGEALDGSYVVGAKAFDAYGANGQTRSITLRLNRRVAYAPARFEAGRNGTNVDFLWSPNGERDIEGYRVYRRPPSGDDVLVCALTQATSCTDTNPPGSLTVDYYVVAVDQDGAGALRNGQASAIDTVVLTNTAPFPPTGLMASTSNGNTVIAWSASAGDPDVGDAVDHYRIYRDGTAVGSRYDRTSTAGQLSFTDSATGGVQHTYYVVAVDTNLAESTKLGPVTR